MNKIQRQHWNDALTYLLIIKGFHNLKLSHKEKKGPEMKILSGRWKNDVPVRWGKNVWDTSNKTNRQHWKALLTSLFII